MIRRTNESRPWLTSFVTYRRYLLDKLLLERQQEMQGLVVDLGGKRSNKRGAFMPSNDGSDRWFYLNIDPTADPDVLVDAHLVALKSGSVDSVICCEVLEHVRNPEQCCSELFRIVAPGGRLFLSVPFLYPIHPDPTDYLRFTPQWIETVFGGFHGIEIIPMGGWLGTLGMMIELGAREIQGSIAKTFIRRILRLIGRMLPYMEMQAGPKLGQLDSFATGYFCIARKSES